MGLLISSLSSLSSLVGSSWRSPPAPSEETLHDAPATARQLNHVLKWAIYLNGARLGVDMRLEIGVAAGAGGASFLTRIRVRSTARFASLDQATTTQA